MTRILHRDPGLYLCSRWPGPYVIDSSGKRYPDALRVALPSPARHSASPLWKPSRRNLTACYAHRFSPTNLRKLAEHLIERAPEGLSRSIFFRRFEAMVALKLARQYHERASHAALVHFPASELPRQYAGALSAGGHPGRRRVYELILLRQLHFSLLRLSRPAGGRDGGGLQSRVADELETKSRSLARPSLPSRETVVGATLELSRRCPAISGRRSATATESSSSSTKS